MKDIAGWMREWLSFTWLDPLILLGGILFAFLILEVIGILTSR